MSKPLHIANQFRFPGTVAQVEEYGSGIINDTYMVIFANPSEMSHPRLGKRAILQRINRHVFPHPIHVIENLEIVLHHINNNKAHKTSDDGFLLPPLYESNTGANYFQDDDGEIWRAMAFIEETSSFDILDGMALAHEVGWVLGQFHQSVHNLPVQQLHDTLPGFHVTPNYLQHYDEVQAEYANRGNDEQRFCQDIISVNRGLAEVLVNARPSLTTRVMHGDPKLNNILFDTTSRKAVSIIDLDTIKPGLIHYDIADCLRSCCNASGEMPAPGTRVEFDTAVCRTILEGYMSSAASFLDSRDYEYLLPAIMLLPFELGLRFFTDYLAGNRYFKVKHPEDNLHRARVQFELFRDIQRKEEVIGRIIETIKEEN